MTNTDATNPTTTTDQPLQGVVVPVDNRPSYERVQDACFEGLLNDYTLRKEWDVVTMVGILWDRVKADRETIQTDVQNSTEPKELP